MREESANNPVDEKVWVVVPALDEAESLQKLIPEILANLDEVSPGGHLLIVDDGSTDRTPDVVSDFSSKDARVSLISVPTNRGKSAALEQGFETALGAGATYVLTMDADGQDDPSELSALVVRLSQGSDLVIGARGKRQDRFIKRTTSLLYNFVVRKVSGLTVEDSNSGFKAFNASAATALLPFFYGELHRYIPVIAKWLGLSISQVQVNHRERFHGKSKYGLNRFWRGFMDLLTVRFLLSYQNRPAHLFGGAGLVFGSVGFSLLGFLLVEWIGGEPIGTRPLLTASVLLITLGFQFLLFGLLAELFVFARRRLPK